MLTPVNVMGTDGPWKPAGRSINDEPATRRATTELESINKPGPLKNVLSVTCADSVAVGAPVAGSSDTICEFGPPTAELKLLLRNASMDDAPQKNGSSPAGTVNGVDDSTGPVVPGRTMPDTVPGALGAVPGVCAHQRNRVESVDHKMK